MTSIDLWFVGIVAVVVFPTYWVGLYLTGKKNKARRSLSRISVEEITATKTSLVSVVGGDVTLRVGDGGYACVTVNGKRYELRSKPGEGSKEMIVKK